MHRLLSQETGTGELPICFFSRQEKTLNNNLHSKETAFQHGKWLHKGTVGVIVPSSGQFLLQFNQWKHS
jgi:hypothetical protein